jgi:formate hydrogenlyase subunit 3/multisubunit Na+/H+ antiporter MnhD subunit
VTIIVDLLAAVAIVAGALMMFAQTRVRCWWAALTGKPIDPKQRRLGTGEDPARYALMIFGMMLLAFGIIILGFFTAFALFTPSAA